MIVVALLAIVCAVVKFWPAKVDTALIITIF
jgi:hypothetical protein